MPHLSDLWSEVSSKRKDVVVLAVNVNDPKERIAEWWAEEGFAHQAVRQQGSEVSEAFGVQAYPTNYVVGPDGKVLFRGVGYDEAALKAALASTAK